MSELRSNTYRPEDFPESSSDRKSVVGFIYTRSGLLSFSTGPNFAEQNDIRYEKYQTASQHFEPCNGLLPSARKLNQIRRNAYFTVKFSALLSRKLMEYTERGGQEIYIFSGLEVNSLLSLFGCLKISLKSLKFDLQYQQILDHVKVLLAGQ